MKKIIYITTLILLLVSCSEKKETEKQTIVPEVTVKKIEPNTEAEVLSYSGTIEADNTVLLGFSVAGRISTIKIQEGQKVQKGQLLASIEQITYKNAFDIANADLEQANDNFNRLQSLYDKNSLPERDFIAVKVAVAQANANKNLAAKNLADTKLYAPFSGIITAKHTEIGATTSLGVPVFTVMKIDKVYAVAAITENEISSLKIGADAQITIPSLNLELKGKISVINPQADNYSKTYTVKVRLDNPEGRLLPGMIADIKINTGKIQNLIIIPSNAVLRSPDNINYVFIAKPNNIAFKKRVNISGVTGNNHVIIKDGIQVGDKLIIEGYTRLEDGMPIKF